MKRCYMKRCYLAPSKGEKRSLIDTKARIFQDRGCPLPRSFDDALACTRDERTSHYEDAAATPVIFKRIPPHSRSLVWRTFKPNPAFFHFPFLHFRHTTDLGGHEASLPGLLPRCYPKVFWRTGYRL